MSIFEKIQSSTLEDMVIEIEKILYLFNKGSLMSNDELKEYLEGEC